MEKGRRGLRRGYYAREAINYDNNKEGGGLDKDLQNFIHLFFIFLHAYSVFHKKQKARD